MSWKLRNSLIGILIGVLLLIPVLPLQHLPAFISAYTSSTNRESQYILNAQVDFAQLIERVDLRGEIGDYAVWACFDDSGVVGQIESASSFHLIRLNQLRFDVTKPSLRYWIETFGKEPKAILFICRTNLKSSPRNVEAASDLLSANYFILKEYEFGPSKAFSTQIFSKKVVK
jgi:hypothetical protein